MAYTFKHGDRPLEGVTIERAVGRGGFGEVYYALADSGKQIALKYLRENPEIELRGVAQVMNLKSPHLVTIYDVRRNGDGECFVLMEYVSGPSLRDVLRAEPRGIGVDRAAAFVRGIAEGLAHLHERGIVHRDLKPANVFYDQGYVKIGDYGLSKHLSDSQHSGQTISVGTVHYMAPEIGSGSYTKLVDIYALGVILYEMLTGRLPFTGESLTEVLMRQLNDQPDTSVLPPGFAPLVARALAKLPQDRYQDVRELSGAVAELVDGQGRPDVLDSLTTAYAARQPEEPEDCPSSIGAPGTPASVTLDAGQAEDWREGRAASSACCVGQAIERPAGMLSERTLVVWLYAYVALDVLFALVELVFGDIRQRGDTLVAHMVVLIPRLIAFCVLGYRLWATLPNGWRRTTPAKAVGFNFIPLFDLYWTFVFTYGLALDVNRFLAKHGGARVRVSTGLALASAVVVAVRSVAIWFGAPTPAFSVACTILGIGFFVSATRACQAVIRARTQQRIPQQSSLIGAGASW